jgi:protein involved in polysaccharide export with SLBB domain
MKKASALAYWIPVLLVSPFTALSQNLAAGQLIDCSDPQNALTAACKPGSNLPSAAGLPGAGSLPAGSSQGAENAPLAAPATQASVPLALPPEPPTEFQKFVAATAGEWLPIFGATLFQPVPNTFSPNALSPPGADYVIGPDDELRIRIWGQVQYSDNLRVDRSGDIYLPQIGVVHVAGLRFAQLDQHLRQSVATMYRNFDLSVDLGRIRSIQIYLAGEARQPGAYTVSSLSTLVDALFSSGGPSAQGSMRHVILKRNGAAVADFDLYALLVRGDKSGDVPLEPEDVLYIPPAGPQVAVTGSVRNPAIYELRGNESIGEIIEAAGKTTAVAAHARISVERVNGHQAREAFAIAFDDSGLATPLTDGDILRIDPILPAYVETITLRGFVANPGRFKWHSGMHLSDLIPDQAALMSRDYWWKRARLGLPAPEFEPAIANPGPAALASGGQSPGSALPQPSPVTGLSPQDGQNAAYSAPPSGGLNPTGNSEALAAQLVRSPERGAAQPSPHDEVRLSTAEINWDYAVIERVDPATLRTTLIPFDLGKLVINHDSAQDLPLQAGDTVTVFSQADIQVSMDRRTKYVNLEGEFVHPGVYSVQPDETLRDLVVRAGGLSSKAYLYGSEFTRESTRIFQQQRIDEYVRDVSAEAARGTQALAITGTTGGYGSDLAASRAVAADLVARLSQVRATGRIVLPLSPESSSVNDLPALDLENGDRFVVPPIPATINVVGAVYDQNSFVFQKGRTLGYYLHLAGGVNRNADWRRAFVIRADGAVLSRPSMQSNLGDWGGTEFKRLDLNPGDTIVIPDKTLRPSALRGAVEWTQVFSQLALGAAAIDVIH